MEPSEGFKGLVIIASMIICALVYGALSIFGEDTPEPKPLITIETIPESTHLDITIVAKRNIDIQSGTVIIASIHGCEYIFYKTYEGAHMQHFSGCQGIVHKVRNHGKE